MYLTAEKKSEIFSQYGKNAADTEEKKTSRLFEENRHRKIP